MKLLTSLRRTLGISGAPALVDRRKEVRRATERFEADRRSVGFGTDWLDQECERRAALAIELNRHESEAAR